jgi:peptide/nickel transport system permease protein
LINQFAVRLRRALGILWKSNVSKVGIVILVGILAFLVGGTFFVGSPNTIGIRNSPPTFAHPFGTDFHGRDLMSQVVWGSFPSLFVALLAAFGTTIVGFLIGSFAGYFRKSNAVLGGATDVVMAIPALPAMVLIGLAFTASNFVIALLLTAFLWPPLARGIRSQVMSVKKLAYVDSARIAGLSEIRVLWKIILPEVAPIAIAYFIINISLGIVIATALEFVGIGSPLNITWGSILYWAQGYAFALGDWWWILAPGIIITLVAASFALIGFSLEEALNPRLRK